MSAKETKKVSTPSIRPGKSRRKALKWLRRIGVAIACILWAFVMICSSVVWILSPERLTPIVERLASENLNADLKLGRAELTFWGTFPRLTVELSDLRIISRSLDTLDSRARASLPANADSVMSVGYFTGSINLFSLAGGEIALSDVLIDRPMVNLLQVNDSVSNFNIFPPSEPSSEPTKIPNISINHFAITNAGPIGYHSLRDTIDIDVDIRTVDLAEDGFPVYKLVLRTDIATPQLRDISYDRTEFRLDGSIAWSGEDPSSIELKGFGVAVDDIALKFDTKVSLTSELAIKTFRVEASDLKVEDILRHLPPHMKEPLASLDTDMKAALTAHIAEPVVVGPNLAIPSAVVNLDIPSCYIKYKDADIDDFRMGLTANVAPGDLDKTVVDVHRLIINGRAIDVDFKGSLTRLITDPAMAGHLRAALDFDKMPKVARNAIGADMRGRFDADTDFSLNMSDLDMNSFHRIRVDGSASLTSFRMLQPTTGLDIYTRLANFDFGTARRFNRGAVSVDSILVINADIDTLNYRAEGMRLALSGMKGGFGTSNRHDNSDTTRITPFGGRLRFDRIVCDYEPDSMKLRMRDVDGMATLRRWQGKAEVPQLALSFDIGRAGIFMQQLALSLRESRFDATAHIRPRPDKAQIDSLRRVASSRRGPTAAQLDSIGADVIDFGVDRVTRNIFMRWDLEGSLLSKSGRMRLDGLPLRNSYKDLDLRFTTDSININSLDYRIGSSDMRILGRISNIRRAINPRRPGDLRLRFDILSDTINLNELARGITAYRHSHHKHHIPFDEWADEEFESIVEEDYSPDSVFKSILIPVNIDGELHIHANNVIYTDMLMKGLDTRVLIYRGAVNMHNLDLSTEMGQINLSAMYTAPTERDMSLGLGLNLRDFHIQRLKDVVPGVDSLMPMLRSLSGIVDASIALTTDITPDMYVDFPTLKAAMQIEGDSLVVFDSDTFRKLSRWLLFKHKDHNMIDSLRTEIVISDGVLNLYPFILNIDRYKLGVMGYNDMNLNFDYHVSVLKSPIPFKFGINIKGRPGKVKVRLGGAKFKENMVAHRDSFAVNTRINLLSEISNAFTRGVEAARIAPLHIPGERASLDTFMNAAEDSISHEDSILFMREGLIEMPDSIRMRLDSIAAPNVNLPLKNEPRK